MKTKSASRVSPKPTPASRDKARHKGDADLYYGTLSQALRAAVFEAKSTKELLVGKTSW